MYGHGIEGMGFFHIEVPDIPPPTPSLLAVVTVLGEGMASPEMIEAELNHLYRCRWDWQMTPTSWFDTAWPPCDSCADSAIVFKGEVGPPLTQIEAIRAREILGGRLDEARSRLRSVVGTDPPARPRPTTRSPRPPMVAVEVRGRTRFRTVVLRAQSASLVLGSSSLPMVQ